MNKVEAIIFDWAGTTLDFGCFAPVQAFKEAFLSYQIEATNSEIREPMGMLKIEHIKTMLEMPRIKKCFHDIYGRDYTTDDVNAIYVVFKKQLMETITEYTQLKPHVLTTVEWLRKQGYKIGSTTGYTDKMMQAVLEKAEAQGYKPDCWFSPDSVKGIGRPYPFMIFKNMETLKVSSVDHVIKVGDTIADIKEGINAGVRSIGIIEGSSIMGLNEEEYNALSANEKEILIKEVKQQYIEADADDVILNLSELPALLEKM